MFFESVFLTRFEARCYATGYVVSIAFCFSIDTLVVILYFYVVILRLGQQQLFRRRIKPKLRRSVDSVNKSIVESRYKRFARSYRSMNPEEL
jgi:hypothetical protein